MTPAHAAPDTPQSTILLRSGTLHLRIDRAEMPLEELCGFASRRSRKRGFVFVSKVLGKHYPVRPARMAATHIALAGKLADVRGPVVFIALAETATGLGQGIHEAWLRQTGRQDALFMHTTRYRLHRPLALDFEETHSHATRHLLYRPADADHDALFRGAETVILVDDEVSTGRTLANLAIAYRRVNPRLAAVHLACLTNWLGQAQHEALDARVGLPVRLHALLEGSYAFADDPTFEPGAIPNVDSLDDCKDGCLPGNHGRLGMRGQACYDLDCMIRAVNPRPHERILVLGSGEFSHPPFLLAQRLEQLGSDVHFQSTTRSPLLVDRDIAGVLEFIDNYHDGIPNYLYNLSMRRYDRIIIGYETSPLPAAHRLAERIGAMPLFF